MGKILCATRGGEGSALTQETAIRLAKETGGPLLFFIAFDLEFMAQANYAMRADVVNEEMIRMAEFLMAIAVERAQQSGVPATYFICQGAFREGLMETIDREQITTVVLGRPAPDGKFKLSDLEEFGADLAQQKGVRVIIPATPIGET